PITSGQGEEVSPPVLQNPYNYREYLDTSSATFVWSSIWGVENAIYNLIIEDHFGNEVKNIERTGSSDILALNEATFSLNNFVTENNKLTLEESPKGTYFWWYVRLKDSKNHKWSEWSEIRMFFIKEAVSGSPPPGGTTPSPGGYSAGVFTLQNPLKYDNFVDLVNAIIVFALQVSIPLATIMFVISGVMFVTSAGEPTKIVKARQIALYTAIGFAVVLSAAGLIKVLQSVLGTQNI
ncbi:MAG: pilin, partial [Candidatus Nealsonbacteria bacterium]|nr:pilin [Candidatus Nealsonbacteria bacterium]